MTYLVFLVAALLVPCSAFGEPPRTINEGQLIRLRATSLDGEYVVKRTEPGFLIVHRPDETNTQRLRVSEIRELAVRRPRTRKEAQIRGAKIGFVVGVGLGATIGLSQGDDPPCTGQEICIGGSALESAALYGVLLGFTGALVGSQVGLGFPGKIWERVDMTTAFSYDLPPRMMKVSLVRRF